MEERVRVAIDFTMSMGLFNCAENSIKITIPAKAYSQIKEELNFTSWSTAMECAPGKQVTNMLRALVKILGYNRLNGWSIRLIQQIQSEEM